MSAKDHPDFKKESEHLEETKQYIRTLINQSVENKEVYQGNMKQAMVDLDHLDSSLSYVNILQNARFLEMTNKEFRNLVRVKDKPYFASMVFTPKNQDQAEKLYIGKSAVYKKDNQEPIVIDWRSPIANLYYEGQLGELDYEANGQTFSGELHGKRQYVIEEGKLEDIRDLEVASRDEWLHESLGGTADSRLKDIVSTIQKEQNDIIREDLKNPVIVQGVAGSGKTTIALHRIAYFIYTYAQEFNPDQFMILAPSRLFLGYISSVLPDLGVEEVRQTTFLDYVGELINEDITYYSGNSHLSTYVEEGTVESENALKVSSLLGSLTTATVIDHYVERQINQMVKSEDLMLERFKIYSASKVHELFYHQYDYLQPYRRIEKMKQVVKGHIKTKKEEILRKVEEVYDNKIEKIRQSIRNKEKRREKVIAVLDRKEKHLKALKKESRSLLNKFMAGFKRKKLLTTCKELFTNAELLYELAEGAWTKEETSLIAKASRKALKQKTYDEELATVLLYLKHRLYGFDKEIKVKNIIVDEAQDYTPFQFFVMKEIFDSNMFTILGDLSQGIFAHKGIHDWRQVQEVLPSAKIAYLRQSYRTTAEIMHAANDVLQASKSEGLVYARPVARHGEVPTVSSFAKENDVADHVIETLEELNNKSYHSIALIGKTMTECEQMVEKLKGKTQQDLQILKQDEELEEGKIAVVPAYIAKGLEFDAAYVFALKQTFKEESELDLKMLYVSMTRPLHHLELVAVKGKEGLMKRVNQPASTSE